GSHGSDIVGLPGGLWWNDPRYFAYLRSDFLGRPPGGLVIGHRHGLVEFKIEQELEGKIHYSAPNSHQRRCLEMIWKILKFQRNICMKKSIMGFRRASGGLSAWR